jgi:protein N-terminal methyltransferase
VHVCVCVGYELLVEHLNRFLAKPKMTKTPAPPPTTTTTTTTTTSWYDDAYQYWNNVKPDVDGMLGGLGHLTDVDLTASRDFLQDVLAATAVTDAEAATAAGAQPFRICECGAGIGRISEGLLRYWCDEVDLVEPTASFLENVRVERAHLMVAGHEGVRGRIRRLINEPLQSFQPPAGEYNIFWCQWVLSHLTDDDLVVFLRRCGERLRPGGFVVVKENVIRRGKKGGHNDNDNDDYIVDNEDSSVTRSLRIWESVFERAGARRVMERWQPGFPAVLYPVRMWALQW